MSKQTVPVEAEPARIAQIWQPGLELPFHLVFSDFPGRDNEPSCREPASNY